MLTDIVAIGHAPILQINRRLYRALARKGWKIELVIPSYLPWAPNSDVIQGAHPEDPPIHKLAPIGQNTRYWWFDGLDSLLFKRRPRIVYLENNIDTVMAWKVGKWTRSNDACLIINSTENDLYSFHEMIDDFKFKPILRTLRSHIWGRLARGRINHVVAMCNDGRRAMELVGFKNNVTVAPLGFDRELFFADTGRRTATRTSLKLIHPAIAYFGRVIPQKGIQHLVAALGQLTDKPWHFLIDEFERDNSSHAWLDSAIENFGIRDRIITFSASHDEVADYMRAADIVVLPSLLKEQYGRVVPEAMACGCVAIVTNKGALPELVGDAGVIVPPGNAAALSSAIADLLNEPTKMADLAERGLARAHIAFSIDRQATILNSLFHRMLIKQVDGDRSIPRQ